MLDKQHSISIIRQLINDENIGKPKLGSREFFLAKSLESLQLSKRIYALCQDKDDPIKSYMWVITTAYYSMFYAATALLAHFNKVIKSEVGIHKLTYHALVYYFLVADNKLQKQFIEEYKDQFDDAKEILQISEGKAVELVENLRYEEDKRSRFTYEMGMIAEANKAKTSLERAEEFVTEIRKLMK